MDYRVCHDAFNVDFDYRRSMSVIKKIIEDAGFISFIGPNCTGKSKLRAFIRQLIETRGNPLTDWDRDDLYNLLITNGDFPQSLHNAVYNFEAQVFEKLYRVYSDHVVLYETVGGRPRWRPNYGQTFGRKSVCLVFDAPLSAIVERFESAQDYYWSQYKTTEEFKMDIEKQQRQYEWPSTKEGWDRIYYINTFGSVGESFLSPILFER
jgi:energy-coupling factor transporter ATP-binding protein EcfA2